MIIQLRKYFWMILLKVVQIQGEIVNLSKHMFVFVYIHNRLLIKEALCLIASAFSPY